MTSDTQPAPIRTRTPTPTETDDSPPGRPTHPPRGHRKAARNTSLVLGLLAALTVAGLGWLYADSQQPQWQAEMQLLVAPKAVSDSEDISTYYETLSSGQVAATAAAIIAETQFVNATSDALGMTSTDGLTTGVAVIPGTSLVKVTVTASSRELAERFAEELPRQALTEVNRLMSPYVVTPLGSTEGSGELAGITGLQFTGAVAMAALIAGLAVQQLFQQLLAVRQRSPN